MTGIIPITTPTVDCPQEFISDDDRGQGSDVDRHLRKYIHVSVSRYFLSSEMYGYSNLKMRCYLFVALLFWVPFIHGTPHTRIYDKIVDCLIVSGVPQVFPGTDNFTQTIIPLNTRLNYTPIAWVVPSTVRHVQAAVRCGAELGVKVNPRSGGHSYASHSIGGEDGHLVVDLKYFRETRVDPATNIATIGPGARLGNVALDLFAQGERALAFGLCPGQVLSPSDLPSDLTTLLIITPESVLVGTSFTAVKDTAHVRMAFFWIL